MSAKLYVVTGASSGLGRHIATDARISGATVVMPGRSEERLMAAHPGESARIVTVPDPSFPSDWKSTIRYIADKWGAINGIVHCAGSEVVAPLRMARDDHYHNAFAATGIAYGILMAAACRGVMATSSSIVLMSSVAASRGFGGMSAYCASRAAIEALGRSAAVELAPGGIRVNCVAPGAFLSPMHARITERMTTEALKAYEGRHLLGFGAVDQVAAAVMFLLRPQSDWITGTTMTVDGGLLAS
jgi:NAD(P)-dependent dehydrogenase (short-subunit alcohol dehydrogenase family)